ncbi:MAG: DMT family transporter [Candidatus Micrarchaeota archaeon]|nr:DMT family transporter [Candidatus Micrarchaeota archaeon]
MFNILALVLGIAIMVFFGASDFVGAKTSRKVGARRAAFWALVFQAIILTTTLLIFYGVPSVQLSYIAVLVLSGVLGSAAFLSYYKGMEVGVVSIVVPIASSWSVITVILSVIFLNQQLIFSEIVGIILLIVGGIFATSDFVRRDLKGSRFSKGLPYAIFSMLAWGLVFFILNIMILKIGGIFSTVLLLSTYWFYYLIYSKATGQKLSIPFGIIPYALAIGLFETIGITSYTLGVDAGNVLIMAPLVASAPAVTIVLAHLLLKERLNKLQYVGIGSVILGLILIAIA